MSSLQGRLRLGLALPLSLLLGLLWWLTAGLMERLTEDLVATRLKHDGQALLAALHFDAAAQPQIDTERLPPVYRQPLSGHYYQLQVQGPPTIGEIRSRSLWDNELALAQLPPGEQRITLINGPGNQPLMLWLAGFEKHGRRLTLGVAEDLNMAQAALRTFHLAFGILTLLIIAAALASQWLVVTRSLRSLEQVRRELGQLEQGRIDTLTPEVPDEIRPLVEEVNRLLILLGQRLERSRNALGNLAHALKSPLALIRQRLEQTPEGPAQRQAGQREIAEQTGLIQRLIERELRRARLAGPAAPGRSFHPAEELPALSEVLKRMHPERQLSFELAAPPELRIPADRDDMLELLGNLLDNAAKWAREKIRCEIEADATGSSIRIDDDGPGCTPQQLRTLTRRGLRLDESVQGHGLGLSIADELVQLYGGEMDFSTSPLGGLRVAIRLPV